MLFLQARKGGNAMKPLDGIKVLDLSKVLAGPLCGMLLGDLGANVIKVEDPHKGDDSRYFPPFQHGVSTFFLACNRNKRAVTLDLKTEKGREAFYRLVRKADVVIESFRTGVTDKLKIDYETLSQINPKLIYCSISGYGRKGPKANHGGYDLLAQAYGGLMSITGLGPDSPPIRAGYSVSDISTGMNAANAILAALFKRTRTSEGELIETSLLQAQLNLMSYYSTMYYNDRKIPQPKGSSQPNFAPYQAFKASDGYMIIGVSNEKIWNMLSSLEIFKHLQAQDCYKTNTLRVENREALAAEMEAVTQRFSKVELLELIEKAGVPCAPINDIEEVVQDEHINFNQMFVLNEHHLAGGFLSPAVPFSMKNVAFDYEIAPPDKGEHNEEVFTEFGFNEGEIAELLRKEGDV
jgi:crotonobetainyl-CoA:carnitine CoA-transferase CaiB-like acyl-CoA transferase